ncbi:MAG: pilin [Candidatus Komeilibacteria bacterium]|nr:pilin [Candidatus Komeilibacteria bacterium]
MTKTFYKTLTVIIAVVVLFSPAVLMAQSIGFGGDNGGTINIIASTGFYNTDDVASETFLDTTFGQLIAIFLGFLGALFLALIIYSGFQWMTAGGNEEKVEESKKRILNASLGFGLIFFAYIITNLVFNFIFTQGGSADAPANNANYECQSNADCLDANMPMCETFRTADGQAKWCTCFRERGPACPQGKTCNENIGGRNSCE